MRGGLIQRYGQRNRLGKVIDGFAFFLRGTGWLRESNRQTRIRIVDREEWLGLWS